MQVHKLTYLMYQLGYTVEQLAEKCKVSRPTISYIRNGRNHSIYTLEKIAKELDVEVTDLIGNIEVDDDMEEKLKEAEL